MKRRTKTISLLAAVMLLVVATIFGTMAYLTSSPDEVKNTFTLGKVNIELDEAEVNPDGTPVEDSEERVKANTYHLLPGHEYVKDPMVTVLKDSEESYVRMKMTINNSSVWDEIFAPDGAVLTNIFGGYIPATWVYKGNVKDTSNNTRTYEFWYAGTVPAVTADTPLTPLFTTITVPGFIDGEQLATLDDFEIVVTADAIQADGFTDADTAWAAFDAIP